VPAFKVFTNTYQSPIQGGAAVWDGSVPFELPRVRLDTSSAACGNGGWHYCENLAAALRIVGLWPNGWSALCVEVEPGADAITRGDKSRASTLTITRVLSDGEIREAIRQLSQPFGQLADHMATEQWAWFEALRRPHRRRPEVEEALRRALKARDLQWEVRGYVAAWDAWDAWDAWAAWDAWDAWDALTVDYAAAQGWIDHDPQLLTTGIRDAYLAGLDIALPTGANELGYAMAPPRETKKTAA
jgi:hypothetical protein